MAKRACRHRSVRWNGNVLFEFSYAWRSDRLAAGDLRAVIDAAAFWFLAENESSCPADIGDFCMDDLLLANKIDDNDVRQAYADRILSSRGRQRRNLCKAEEYAKLKMELQKRFRHNRDAYTEAKGDFILACVKEARVQ